VQTDADHHERDAAELDGRRQLTQNDDADHGRRRR